MDKVNSYLALAAIFVTLSTQSLQHDTTIQINNPTRTAKILSRKRRFLLFPSGSSLQLVYCLEVPIIGAAGQIFALGITAALAWELPDKPDFIHDLLDHKKGKTTTEAPETTTLPPLHHDHDHDDMQNNDHPSKRIDKPFKYFPGSWTSQGIKYSGAASDMKTYYNPFLISKPTDFGFSPINTMPHFSTYSNVHKDITFSNYGLNRRVPYAGEKRYKSNPYKHSYYKQTKKAPVSSHVHPAYHQHHRRTRRDLYEKIEKLFTALSKDGKACLLKAICEVSQAAPEKGTFMEEMIKVIFRVKPHEDYPNEDKYDAAANKNHNCTELYPTCEGTIWSTLLRP